MECPTCGERMYLTDAEDHWYCHDCSEYVPTPERMAELEYHAQLYRGLQHAPGYIQERYGYR